MLKPILITRRFLSSSSAVTVWIQIVKYKRQLRDKPPAQHRKSSLQFYRLDILRLQSRQPRKVQDAAKNAGLNTIIECQQEKNCPPVDGGDAMLWTHVKYLAVP